MSDDTKIHRKSLSKRTLPNGDVERFEINAGYFAVSPNDDLVALPLDSPLKSGWRLATQGDLDRKEHAEYVRSGQAGEDANAARAELEAALEKGKADHIG